MENGWQQQNKYGKREEKRGIKINFRHRITLHIVHCIYVLKTFVQKHSLSSL